MIVGKGLGKSISGQKILSDISITVEPGASIALIGPSGSGKSTLLRLLSFLDKPSEGSVVLLKDSKPTEKVWPAVVPVFQQLFLWPHMTALENVELAVRQQAKDRRVEIRRFFEYFRLDGRAGRYPNELSLGEKQRVALIRALILRPQFILLDEVTSALDVEQIDLVIEKLKEVRKLGVGVVFVTHLIGFARRLASEVFFLDQGRVVEKGAISLLENPQSKRIADFLAVA